jgi:hypothetical protein
MPFMMDEPRMWLELTLPYAVLRLRQTNGQAVWRRVGAMVNVVHALQSQTLVQIHLQNDLIGLIQPGFVVAHRGRRDQPPPRQDACHLNHGHIQVAQQTRPNGLRHMRQMHVVVEHVPGIDLLAAGWIRLVGQAHLDALSPSQSPIEFRPCGRPGPQTDPRLRLPRRMQSCQPRGQRLGHRLEVSRAREAAHAHIRTDRDQGRRFVSPHHFGVQAGVLQAYGQAGRQGHEEVPIQKVQYVPSPVLDPCACANGRFTRGLAGGLSGFAHKQRTNQWFETAPKLATMPNFDGCKLGAPWAVTEASARPRGLLQDNRAVFETFEEKTPWPKQHHQKTMS